MQKPFYRNRVGRIRVIGEQTGDESHSTGAGPASCEQAGARWHSLIPLLALGTHQPDHYKQAPASLDSALVKV